MDFRSLHAEYTELGETFVVGRSALVMTFQGKSTELLACAEPIFDLFKSALPPKTELHVLGGNDRQYKPITPQSERRFRATLTKRWCTIKDTPAFEAGHFSLEIGIGAGNPTTCDRIDLSFPVEWGDLENVERTVGFFSQLARFPFFTGVAGYGFSVVWGREFEQVAMPVNFQAARRLRGVLLRDRAQTPYLIKRVLSAGWLTYLNEEMVGLVGGEKVLRDALAGQVTVTPLGTGLILRAGAVPPLGDVNRQDNDVAPLAAVNRAIKNIRAERWRVHGPYGADTETIQAWLRRLD